MATLAARDQENLTYAHQTVPIRLDAGRFDFHLLGQENAIPTCAPDSAGRPRFGLEGAATIPYLSYGTASFFAQALAQLFAHKPLPLVTVYENAMSAGLKAMAIAGHGVAWIPESLIREEMRTGALVPAGGREWFLESDIRLYRNRARARPSVELFWSALGEDGPQTPLSATRESRR